METLAPLKVGDNPGTVARLNSLPPGTIICDSSQLRIAEQNLGWNWRKRDGDTWVLYKGRCENITAPRTVDPVSDPDGIQNLSSGWLVYRMGMYVISEEPY